jgi:diacylglycerol kinase (ATP)
MLAAVDFLVAFFSTSATSTTSASVLLIIAGFYFDISHEEWLIQTLAIGLVLGIEGINTAVEKVADFIHPEFHERIGFIKDISAGAVFFAAMAAITIFCIIFLTSTTEDFLYIYDDFDNIFNKYYNITNDHQNCL